MQLALACKLLNLECSGFDAFFEMLAFTRMHRVRSPEFIYQLTLFFFLKLKVLDLPDQLVQLLVRLVDFAQLRPTQGLLRA